MSYHPTRPTRPMRAVPAPAPAGALGSAATGGAVALGAALFLAFIIPAAIDWIGHSGARSAARRPDDF